MGLILETISSIVLYVVIIAGIAAIITVIHNNTCRAERRCDKLQSAAYVVLYAALIIETLLTVVTFVCKALGKL